MRISLIDSSWNFLGILGFMFCELRKLDNCLHNIRPHDLCNILDLETQFLSTICEQVCVQYIFSAYHHLITFIQVCVLLNSTVCRMEHSSTMYVITHLWSWMAKVYDPGWLVGLFLRVIWPCYFFFFHFEVLQVHFTTSRVTLLTFLKTT